MLAALGGCALQLQQPALWPAVAYAAGLAVAVATALVLRRPVARRSSEGARRLLLGLAIAAAAFAVTGLRAGWRLADRLPAALEGHNLQLTGTVVGLPQPGPEGVRFQFAVEAGRHDGVPVAVPRRVSLSWTRGFDGDGLIAGPVIAVEAGQRWTLPVRLKQPHGLANPHGFDLELWLFEQRIGATGTVRAVAGATPRLLAAAAGRSTAPAKTSAMRSCCTCPIRQPPACWRRWRWATRPRSRATTGRPSASPASRT
jgi:competence protein ComEC